MSKKEPSLRGFADGDPRNARIDQKRRDILAAARGQLCEAGYEATTVDAIAARSGVSKMTIYRHFGSGDALVEALILSLLDGFNFRSLSVSKKEDLTETLEDFGMKFGAALMSPASLQLYKAIIMSSERAPELAKAFQDRGRASAQKVVADFLRTQLDLSEAAAARRAEEFDALVLGDLFQKCLLGLSHYDEDAHRKQVKRAVSFAVKP
ncbi:TetR/AcrR family transcriptional regulator [Ruegeria sp. SCPT10]|uniref:TetR/AcrR family transcriptional regulator n=1 Tax=Ruegeria sp. SCP10 TaxID=3141377 RepID=UPI003336B4B1